MTDLPDFSRDLAPLGLVALNHLATQTRRALVASREYVSGNLRPGERIAAVAPDGTVLGHITRKVDTTEARVVDESALMAHLHEHNPDSLIDVDTIRHGTPSSEVVAVLKEHAPHLVDSRPRIQPWALNAALTDAKTGATVPGVELATVPGTTAIYPDKAAAAAIEGLIRSGVVGVDGTVNRLTQTEGATS